MLLQEVVELDETPSSVQKMKMLSTQQIWTGWRTSSKRGHLGLHWVPPLELEMLHPCSHRHWPQEKRIGTRMPSS